MQLLRFVLPLSFALVLAGAASGTGSAKRAPTTVEPAPVASLEPEKTRALWTSLVQRQMRARQAAPTADCRPMRLVFYAATDWLAQRQPLLAGGLFDPSKPDDETTRVLRAAIGVVWRLRIGVLLKLEYAYWDFDAGAPDAHRVATQVVVPF